MTLRYASSGALQGDSVPIIRNISIRDSAFENLTKQAIFIEGYSRSDLITDVTIANCNFIHAGEVSFITNAARVYLTGTHGSGLERETYCVPFFQSFLQTRPVALWNGDVNFAGET
jgi:hypothetical protein